MSRVESSVVGSAVAIVAFCSVMGCCKDDSSPTGTTSKAQIQLTDLDGRPFDIWQNTSYRVVLFARTDCPISNRYAPEIRRLYDLYRPRGVEFYLIYVDPREEPDTIRQHLREYGYQCIALRDPHHALAAH